MEWGEEGVGWGLLQSSTKGGWGPPHSPPLSGTRSLTATSPPFQAPQPQAKGTPSLGEVMQWMEVYNRSFCQPKEMLVPVMKTRYLHSHLGQLSFVEHSACECRPKSNSKVNPERPGWPKGKNSIGHKHKKKRPLERDSPHLSSCPPCSDKRKRQDPQTCQCRCRRRSQHCRDRGLELNEHSCRCEKLRR
ncbi:vascular endothelial growth factor B isoform 4-T4 [Pangshura tecta]